MKFQHTAHTVSQNRILSLIPYPVYMIAAIAGNFVPQLHMTIPLLVVFFLKRKPVMPTSGKTHSQFVNWYASWQIALAIGVFPYLTGNSMFLPIVREYNPIWVILGNVFYEAIVYKALIDRWPYDQRLAVASISLCQTIRPIPVYSGFIYPFIFLNALIDSYVMSSISTPTMIGKKLGVRSFLYVLSCFLKIK